MQRRYLWPATRVRDLLDSLYRVYPTGTILVWETDTPKPTRNLPVPQEENPFEAMINAPGFGKRIGVSSIVLAAIALVGISLIPVLGETSIVAVLAVPVFIILPIVWGWKVYRLSKTP